MKTWISAFVLAAALGGTALAQPLGPQPPPEEPPPPPPPAPAPPPPAPPPPAHHEPMPAPITEPTDPYRPSELSVGIGAGYTFPTSLETPNTTSVRLRLPSGLTFEPRLTFAQAAQEIDTGTSVRDEQSEISLATLVRYPVIARGRVDFEVLGAVAVRNATQSPDQPNADTTTTQFSVGYGLAVTSWITSHWNLSFTAGNPLFTSTKVKQDMGPGFTTVTTTNTLGLIFDPTVQLMIHLYY